MAPVLILLTNLRACLNLIENVETLEVRASFFTIQLTAFQGRLETD